MRVVSGDEHRLADGDVVGVVPHQRPARSDVVLLQLQPHANTEQLKIPTPIMCITLALELHSTIQTV